MKLHNTVKLSKLCFTKPTSKMRELTEDIETITCQQIKHVMFHVDTKPQHEIITQLEDIDSEDLLITREELFTQACKKFDTMLEEKGIQFKPQHEDK